MTRPARSRSQRPTLRLPGVSRLGAVVGAGLLAAASTDAAGATCSPSYIQWLNTTTPGLALASMPVHDTNFNVVPGRSRAYFTQGTQLFTVYNQNYPAGCTPGSGSLCAPTGGTCSRLKGCKLGTWSASPPAPLPKSPYVVPISNPALFGGPAEMLFLGAENGRLYRLNVTGEPPFPEISADTRRPSCVADRVVATPAVQLYAYSNAPFQSSVDAHPGHAGDDVVFVVTSTGCGDGTRNRVIAYFASDLTVKWEFNAPRIAGDGTGPLRMGGGTEGCSLDYANDRLYCGTLADPGTDQDSLWAISTIDGQLRWSDNPGGGGVNRPILNPNNNRLYVVSRPGSLWAYNPAGNGLGGPSKLWTAGLSVASPGAVVAASPWVEPRPGTWQDKILVLDSAGQLYAIQDNGPDGSLLWTAGSGDGTRWVSAPVVLPGPTVSHAFLGRDDGQLQMIQLDGGRPQGTIQIASTANEDVYDPSIDADPVTGAAVVVVGGTRVARITVPICPDDPASSPVSCFDECFLPGSWDPFCVAPDTSCRSYSCRDPGSNPQYNPCRSLVDSASACVGHDYPDCFFGGVGCTSQGDVPDGTACDDGWPGAPGGFAGTGAGTCRADPIPAPAACTLPEGTDCDPQTGFSAPGSRHKCVTKPSVCGATGGGKCCVCNDGYGTNCNDRCYRGQCVSDLYTGCPGGKEAACISAGDRACAPGTTCCGSSRGSPCASDFDCSAAPQGTCLDVDPLDGDPTKRCYYQQCVNLSDDPQHCGACATDCGEYVISAAPCVDDLACGACIDDADCGGAGGKCVDGACGRCQGDIRAPGPACGAPCASDSQCGGGTCTNGFCCAFGSECAEGACRPLVCHRLVNRGTCAAGVCSEGAACSGPSPADLAAAGQPGTSSIDFEYRMEFDGTSACSAYASSYRTDGGPPLARIDPGGAATGYTASPPDATRLNGVAVSRDGSQLLASMVNSGGGIPGLALRGPGASTYSRAKTAAPTGGLDDNPFDQSAFNTGPVGPAFDYVTFTGDATRKMWFGNFQCPAAPVDGPCTCTDLGLCRVDYGSGFSWSATPEPYCNQPCADPDGRCEYATGCAIGGSSERITAIAFGQRLYAPTNLYHRYLVVAHGTTLSIFDLDGGVPRQADVNLASPAVRAPDALQGESTVEAILSIALTPYGDVVAEVRGEGDQPAPGNARNTWLLNVGAHDRSCRHERDVQRGLQHVNPCGDGGACPGGFSCNDQVCMKACGSCPAGFSCVAGFCRITGEVPPNFGVGAGLEAGNGRLTILPNGNLLRWIATVDTAPTTFAEYDITRGAGGGSGCDDGDPCTVDSFNAGTGQCEHVPVVCDDLDACTVDSCSPATGQCVATPLSCDDNDPCTADSCETGTGACLHAPIVLTEPGPVQLPSITSIEWPATMDATHWNTYRGTIPKTGLGGPRPTGPYDHVCHESGDAFGDGPTTSSDGAFPSPGSGYYYLVSGWAGCESVVGRASSGAEIPNPWPCLPPP